MIKLGETCTDDQGGADRTFRLWVAPDGFHGPTHRHTDAQPFGGGDVAVDDHREVVGQVGGLDVAQDLDAVLLGQLGGAVGPLEGGGVNVVAAADVVVAAAAVVAVAE